MRYAIEFLGEAKQDLRLLSASLRARIADEIEMQLRHEPLVRTRNRKPLRGKLAPRWELKVGEHRVMYRVDGLHVLVLAIVRKGRKTTEDVT